uniref:Uncharacterized protein n=1 Tax=Arundo donax TaxID=35708 RepID=A0A0A9E7Z9_ARUDO
MDLFYLQIYRSASMPHKRLHQGIPAPSGIRRNTPYHRRPLPLHNASEICSQALSMAPTCVSSPCSYHLS